MSRSSTRIDYKVLSETGERVPKTVVTNKNLRDCDQSSLSGNESGDQFVDCLGSPASFDSPVKVQIEDPAVTALSEQLFTELSVHSIRKSNHLLSQSVITSPVTTSLSNSLPSSLSTSLSTSSLGGILAPSMLTNIVSSSNDINIVSSSNDINIIQDKSLDEEPCNFPEPCQILKLCSGIAHWVKGISLICNNTHFINYSQRLRRNMSGDLMSSQEAIGQDVDDFLDENPVDDCFSADEIDCSLRRVEDLRTMYRLKHIEYKNASADLYDDTIAKEFNDRLNNIKAYILDCKKKRRLLVGTENAGVLAAREKSFNFNSNEILRLCDELASEFKTFGILFTDEEITKRKQDLPLCSKKLEQVAKLIKELHGYNKDGSIEINKRIDDLTLKYEKICTLKTNYVAFINDQEKIREISKKELFNEGKLKIQLSKFNGYDSKMDIYSFQSQFYKIHDRTVPNRYMSDVLKNNFLDGPALSLVKNIDDITEIWDRLKSAYGDTKLLLKKKLNELETIPDLWKSKGPEKISNSLTKIINVMRDLMKLAEDHDIEGKLYNGDGLDRLYRVIGDDRLTKWLTLIADKTYSDKRKWSVMIDFLETDLKVQQQKVLIRNKPDEKSERSDDKDKKSNKPFGNSSHYTDDDTMKCFFCEGKDHVATNGPRGMKVVQYFACKKFVEAACNERIKVLRDKGFCIQCLFPGAKQDRGKHQEGKCQHDFVCRHESHSVHTVRKHVLVCHEHRDTEANKKLLEEYKNKCIIKRTELPSFSREIRLSLYAGSYKSSNESTKFPNIENDVEDRAIYMLQNIVVDGKEYTVFYDSGCSEMVSSYSAVQELGSRAVQVVPGPLKISGIGNVEAVARHGVYQLSLPLFNGNTAKLSGLCLDEITQDFPTYPLQGELARDIQQSFKSSKLKTIKELPKLPATVGGSSAHIMIGSKYRRYQPKEVFRMDSGLTILESCFMNPDGSRGVVCGPHSVITGIEANYHVEAFMSAQYELFRNGYQVNPDVALLHFRPDDGCIEDIVMEHNNYDGSTESYISRKAKLFQDVESAGSEIQYRCTNCRKCKVCKEHESIDNISIKEEIEQELINRSVSINQKEKYIEAGLPMIYNPLTKLPPSNRETALNVYNRVVKQLNKLPDDKDEVIKSEKSMQTLGFVDYVSNLSPEDQKTLDESSVKYYIPWIVVFKLSSISTPCRMVFDGSLPTSSGYSLNDILAKGKNNLNKLVEIVIQWFIYRIAFHTDIRKMYNTVRLKKSFWTFQRYIWQCGLDPKKIPVEKIIKTIIYGLRSSGNQAGQALLDLVTLWKEEFPEVYMMIRKNTYMDDCIAGAHTVNQASTKVDELEGVLNSGGFSLKAVTFSNKLPPENMSSDGVSVSVAGMRWYPEEDVVSLDVSKLNFSKRRRGKKHVAAEDVIPDQITRRNCVSRTAEIFDIAGKVTPFVAMLKVALHELITRQLSWDDKLPDDLRSIWTSHFQMIKEINNIKYKRAIIPEDAVSVDVETLDFGDASKKCVCVAIYARFLRKNGEYSCQLVFGRSKIISNPLSQPRAELLAATLNTHTGEVVKRGFGKYFRGSLKVTDSQVVMFWVHNDSKPMKQWPRNRVIEIRRYTDKDDWRHTSSGNMIADIGTRRVDNLSMIDQNSVWINGYPWMKFHVDSLPFRSIEDIKLNDSEVNEIKKESLNSNLFEDLVPFDDKVDDEVCMIAKYRKDEETVALDKVKECYKFSNYLLDPNRRNYQVIIRVMAFVFRYINNLKASIQRKRNFNYNKDDVKYTVLTEQEIQAAKNYYFKKGTEEVKNFVSSKEIEKISKEENGILYYTGRILPTERVNAIEQMPDAMRDLAATTFCVPVLYMHSPLSYSIVNHVHWYSDVAKHSGVETVWRYVMKEAFIISGRSLVKKFKITCLRCRYLRKKFIDVEMGPVSGHNLTIAPAFYSSQVDIFGPFKAFDSSSKRKTVKVWFVVYCCSTTATISIKVMEDYGTDSFILAFIRFACDAGFPKTMLVDEGSQLVKGCDTMNLTFRDVKNRLHREFGVDYEVCPVGGHNVNGKVERRIRHIKDSISKVMINERLSFIQWETLVAQVANTINDLPLALGNIVSDFENMDLLTPNRLKLGRNNDRAPVFPVETASLQRIIEQNKQIFQTWFSVWLVSHVPKLMEQPKWYTTERDLKICDIVLMLKHEGNIGCTYQYGMVHQIQKNTDGVTRKAQIKYRNSTEDHDRYTWRSVRQLVMIHPVDELSIMEQMAQCSSQYCK